MTMLLFIVGFIVAGAVAALVAKRDAQWKATMQAFARPGRGEEAYGEAKTRIRDIEKQPRDDNVSMLRGVSIFIAAFVVTLGAILTLGLLMG
jgi:hypothetical protein